MRSEVISFDTLQDHFHHLVIDAIDNQHVDVAHDTTHYLSSLLVAYSSVDALFEKSEDGLYLKPLAVMYGEAYQQNNASLHYQSLRQLGDTALFIAGMFPGVLHRKPVGLDYYIAMGGNAYDQVSGLVARLKYSDAFKTIFTELGQSFALMVDVLSEVSEQCHLNNHSDLLQLYEQWMQTGSKHLENKLRNAGIEPAYASSNMRH